ncbi:MAG: hypothetical protein IKO10_11240 [Lachnospiraceae bacterium]|nr:hypothetical protein [Lachnospiraceae bacterium]
MRAVEYSGWASDIEEYSKMINCVKDQIHSVTKKLDTPDISADILNTLMDNICKTLDEWTGTTYVGEKKNPKISKMYQMFFIELYSFVLACQKSEIEELREFAGKVLYRGKLFRYLGHGDCQDDIECRVEPVYNDIYVSWSKKRDNSYLKSKLYGTITVLCCEIKEPYYGIDLAPFGVVRADEAEVVFPTVENTMLEVRYIEEEDR